MGITSNISAIDEAKTGGARLVKMLEGNWWEEHDPEEIGTLGSLLHHLNTGLKADKDKPNSTSAVDRVLEKLVAWAEERASTSPQTVKIKAAKSKRAASQPVAPVALASPEAGDRVSRESQISRAGGAGDKKLQQSIDMLKGELDRVNAQLRDIETKIVELNNRGSEQEVSARHIIEQLALLGAQFERNHKDQAQVLHAVDELRDSTRSNFDSLDLRLEAIEAKLSERIHIRESTQILEIREEVERFVEADLVKKISRQVMPALAVLKSASTQDIGKAIADLDSRCAHAGLIPIERLFA